MFDIPFAFQVMALLSAGASLMVCLRSSVGRPGRLVVTLNSLNLFGNLPSDTNPALPGARNPHVLAWQRRLLCAGRLGFASLATVSKEVYWVYLKYFKLQHLGFFRDYSKILG